MSKPKGDEIAYTYVGPGYFHGIPAENLSADAFAALSPEYQRKVRIGGIYDEVTDASSQRKAKADAEAKAERDGDK